MSLYLTVIYLAIKHRVSTFWTYITGSQQAVAPHHVWVVVPSNSHHNSAHAVIQQSLQGSPRLKISMVIHRSLEPFTIAYFHKNAPTLLDRLTLVSYGSAGLSNAPENWGALLQEVKTLMAPTLLNGVHEPTRFVLSMFNASQLTPVVRLVWPGIPVWMHWSSCAGWLYNLLRPSPNGAGDYKEVMERIRGNKKNSAQEAMLLLSQVIFSGNGTTDVNDHLVELPGIPPMYNYELHAENSPTPPALAAMIQISIDGSRKVDGITMNTSNLLEKEMCEGLSKYCKPYALGLQVDDRAWKKSGVLPDGPVKAFLDKHREGKGVLYISFGTAYFPKTYLEEFIDTLVESDQPFILVTRTAQLLSPALSAKVAACAHALRHTDLLDQIAVLCHPATRWSLNQGGWLSISEALVTGVPQIVWPLGNNDQAYNAALISTRDKPLGLELLQVRQGKAARISKRGVEIKGTAEAVREELRTVLKSLNGEETRAIRENVEEMAEALRADHEQTGKEVLRLWQSLDTVSSIRDKDQ